MNNTALAAVEERQMSNRKEQEARAVEASRGYQDDSRQGPRENPGGWRSDLDEELRRFFSGDFVGDAGLRSSFGSQLERARDGLSDKNGSNPMLFLGADSHGAAIWCRSDLPARCVDFGRAGLGVNRVIAAFRGMQQTAVSEVVDAERARFKEKFKAKEEREPTRKEVDAVWPKPEVVEAALRRVERQAEALAAFYTPRTPGEMWGLLGIEPFAMNAALSKPIVDMTREWLGEQRDAELERFLGALTASQKEAAERIDDWDAARDELLSELDGANAELVSHADESGAVPCVNLARRRQLLRRQALIPGQEEELRGHVARIRAGHIPQIDTEGMIRRKWDRSPTRDELKGTLRRVCDDAKRLKTPDLRAAAEKKKYEALAAARRDVMAARAAYAAERVGRRGGGAPDRPDKRATDAASRKRQAILADFEERTGLR